MPDEQGYQTIYDVARALNPGYADLRYERQQAFLDDLARSFDQRTKPPISQAGIVPGTGSTTTGPEDQALPPGMAEGGVATGPTLVGEGRGTEYVIPTDPQHRERAVALWKEAGQRLGIQGMEAGGKIEPAGYAAVQQYERESHRRQEEAMRAETMRQPIAPPAQPVHQQLAQQQITQPEIQRRQRLQQAQAQVQEKLDNGEYEPEEAHELFQQIEAGLTPLNQKFATTRQLVQRQTQEEAMHAAALGSAIQQQDNVAASAAIPHRIISLTPPGGGQATQFFAGQHGNIMAVPHPEGQQSPPPDVSGTATQTNSAPLLSQLQQTAEQMFPMPSSSLPLAQYQQQLQQRDQLIWQRVDQQLQQFAARSGQGAANTGMNYYHARQQALHELSGLGRPPTQAELEQRTTSILNHSGLGGQQQPMVAGPWGPQPATAPRPAPTPVPQGVGIMPPAADQVPDATGWHVDPDQYFLRQAIGGDDGNPDLMPGPGDHPAGQQMGPMQPGQPTVAPQPAVNPGPQGGVPWTGTVSNQQQFPQAPPPASPAVAGSGPAFSYMGTATAPQTQSLPMGFQMPPGLNPQQQQAALQHHRDHVHSLINMATIGSGTQPPIFRRPGSPAQVIGGNNYQAIPDTPENWVQYQNNVNQWVQQRLHQEGAFNSGQAPNVHPQTGQILPPAPPPSAQAITNPGAALNLVASRVQNAPHMNNTQRQAAQSAITRLQQIHQQHPSGQLPAQVAEEAQRLWQELNTALQPPAPVQAAPVGPQPGITGTPQTEPFSGQQSNFPAGGIGGGF